MGDELRFVAFVYFVGDSGDGAFRASGTRNFALARFLMDDQRRTPVITLTRLNGATLAINPELITVIDVTPDTTISLLNGDRIIVRERLDEVIDRVVHFRQSISGRPPNVVDALAASRGENVPTHESGNRRTPKREG